MGGHGLVGVNVHREWLEPIEAERKALGCDSKPECLDKIFGSYFGRKGEDATMAGSEQPPQQPASAAPPTPQPSISSGDITALARQVGELTAALTGSQAEAQRWQQEAEAKGTELERWQTMEQHAPVPAMLDHLASCPNCQPQLQSFLDRYVNTLPPDRLKGIARQQKWWPPPSIDLGGALFSRKARP